ncbi:NAD(P)-binding domain-containing protein [Tsukamurella strandjordii]|uniref:NAD(P)-binding domain-containing protein n=1 Tax=Tsukamurella strandjordii TaxID=147577 RepID=A0AA90NSU1_9ACTN|nr:NAD(P)-binding domain-containing protein [Tsukamurella strandjordii]MDP0400189.1 NAD(P)-binding domain-containing protein [Tsukamurella strandjordii]
MEKNTSHDVTVLGCGLMGAALARTLAGAGHSVAVWNRTHAKAEALASEAITPVPDVADAVAAAPLVLACLSTYDDALAALQDVPDWTGVTLVNVGSGTPVEVEAFGEWARGRGTDYLDGSILGYPADIGAEAAAILYSGSESAWAAHGETLTALTPMSVWVSSEDRTASVLNAGLVGMFLVPAVSAYVEAATYMLGQGVDRSLLDNLTPAVFGSIQAETARAAAAIDGDDFATDQATIATYAQGLDGAAAIMAEAGIRARVFTAAVENLTVAVDAGLGDLGFAAQARIVASG